MAEKLGAGGAKKVTKAPTRAAKGAGGSKPKAEARRLKESIPKPKSRVDPVPGGASHDAQIREALELQLIGLRQKHRAIDSQIEVMNEELKELRTKKKEIRSAISTAGMPLNLFDEAYNDAGTSRVDLDKKEMLRSIVRGAFGLVSAPQGDLLAKVPDAVKPEVYWEAEGYKDGIAGKDPKIPRDCPPENGPHYMRGYTQGQTRIAQGIKKLEKADPAVAPEGEAGLTSAEVVGVVEGLVEDVKNGSGVPPTGIEKLDQWANGEDQANGQERPDMAETMEVTGVAAEANGGGAPADDFEASPAELGKQNPRRAIKEKRESQLLN